MKWELINCSQTNRKKSVCVTQALVTLKILVLQHEKREFRGATDVSCAEIQNRDARKAPPTDVPTLAAATGCTCRFLWTPPTHLLPFRKLMRLQNEQWGGNVLCTSRNPGKTLTEHSKMFMLEPISREKGKQVPEGLSEQFPEDWPCTSRACLN